MRISGQGMGAASAMMRKRVDLSSEPVIDAIVLAAGESRRLGQPKQLLRFGETTLIEHIVALSQQVVRRTIVVLGAFAEQIEPSLHHLSPTIVKNPEWREGMASSIRVGISALQKTPPDAFFLLVCDQPRIGKHHLDEMVDLFCKRRPAAVAACYCNRLGVPVLAGWSLSVKLRQLRGAEGARKVLRGMPEGVVAYDLPAALSDIDTLEDLQKLSFRELEANRSSDAEKDGKK